MTEEKQDLSNYSNWQLQKMLDPLCDFIADGPCMGYDVTHAKKEKERIENELTKRRKP